MAIMSRYSRETPSRFRLAVIMLFTGFAAVYLIVGSEIVTTVSSQIRRPARPAARATPRPTPAPPKYSQFPHDIKGHNANCTTCHTFPSDNWNKVRTGDGAFPDVTEYPKHESCINCHRQQFYRGARPTICSICHVNPSPRDSRRHPFPNPREIFDASEKGKTAASDFAIDFPHDKHIEIVSANRSERQTFRLASYAERRQTETSCAVCHATLNPQGESDSEYLTKPPADIGDGFWLKKGTFKAIPTGHTTCFTCHSQDSGLLPAPQDCAACHKPKGPMPAADFDAALALKMNVTDRVTLDLWKRRDSSGTFRHEWFSHSELSCSTCHNVEAMKTTDRSTTKVGLASCTMCHATASVDDGGVLNFEVAARKENASFRCTKCHVSFGTRPVPESHLKAIIEAGGTP
jgi:hypothetical protein